MKIVVTGALGHIGSRLTRTISHLGGSIEMVLVDNLSTQRYCSLFDLPRIHQYRFVEADILTSDLRSIFRGAEVVIHLAAITDAVSSFDNPENVEQVNLEGTKAVGQACAANGCALFFPSTTSVYGTQAVVVDEDCSPEELRPQSPYAESKLAAENFLQELASREGLRFVVCRFGTIFGTSVGMRFHTAINKFCWQAVMEQPLTVWRTAYEQKRPYLDLSDAVKAVEFFVGNRLFDGRVYNVLTLNSTVRHIVETIQAIIPQLSVNFVDTQIMNQLSYDVSSLRIRNMGFQFSGSLSGGIAETIALLKHAQSGSVGSPPS